jgi:hypothetical protein
MNKFNDKEYWDFLDEWKEAREYALFCEDGLLDVEKWDNTSRIMFLLKESYDDFYQIHDCKTLGPGSKAFFRKIRLETYILDELINGNKPDLEKALEIKESPIDSIAYVNIKKSVEHNRQSPDADIEIFARQDKEYLLRQINLISPNIIICSGTFKFCKWIFNDITPISKNLSKTANILLFDYWHPSSRAPGYEEIFGDFIRLLGGYFHK